MQKSTSALIYWSHSFYDGIITIDHRLVLQCVWNETNK